MFQDFFTGEELDIPEVDYDEEKMIKKYLKREEKKNAPKDYQV